MSTGDWFSLRPLNFNFDDINQRLTNVETRLTNVEGQLTRLDVLTNQIDGLNFVIQGMQMQLDAVGTIATNNQTTLTKLSNTVNDLSTQVNNFSTQLTTLQTNVNSLLDLYKPISWFTYNSVRFTDINGNTTYGSFRGAWYRPIKFLDVYSNEGVDLKLLVLAIREFTINNIPSGVTYNSDPLLLPLPPVNNNDFRVFWCNTVPSHEMNTKEAVYTLYYIPVNTWGLSVMNRSGAGINSGSAWFLMGYF